MPNKVLPKLLARYKNSSSFDNHKALIKVWQRPTTVSTKPESHRSAEQRRWRDENGKIFFAGWERKASTPNSKNGKKEGYVWREHESIHTYTHTHIHTYTHTHIRTYAHTHIPTYAHTHIHTYAHTHIHTYTHTHIYTHAHTHTHTLPSIDKGWKFCIPLLIPLTVLMSILRGVKFFKI